MKTLFKTLLKVFGWIFVLTAVIGGPCTMITSGISWITLMVLAMYIVLANLCFRAAKKLEIKNEQQ